MDKFTKEQQVQAVYDLRVGYTLGHADIAMLKSMARQLLASMEQEPVAWLLSGGGAKNHVSFDGSNAYDPLREVTPLYAAPQLPQPAVAITQHFDTIALDTAKMVMCDVNRRDEFLGGDIQLLSRIQCRIDEACRAAMLKHSAPFIVTSDHRMMEMPKDEDIDDVAAMLQGAEPASNCDELPLDYLQGHKDGLEWAAQMAEANHPQTGDWLYDDPIELARAIRKGPDMPTAQAGNSPVIGIDLASEPDRSVEVRYFAPPGYVMVPKEPTEAMMLHKSGCKDHPWDDPECVMRQTRRLVWAHMLEAAAQQEVKSSLEHGMQRYAGAMQKLADAGD